MNSEEFQHLVMHLRQVGVDTQTCEVKESADKLSSSLVETLSAFANSSRGGTIILGLSEKNGFLPVKKIFHCQDAGRSCFCGGEAFACCPA